MKLRELRHNLWNIGFIEEGLENLLVNKHPTIHWVKKRFTDRWFADPFILDVTENEIVVLAEEYCYEVRRGRIARLVIDRKTYIEKAFEVIMDISTHLSFPFIFRLKDRIYILPENSASGSSTIYEYDDASRSVKLLHHYSDEPFTDATVFKMDSRSYLFTTKLPDPNSYTVKIYSFDDVALKVSEQIDSVNFPIRCGRNAGEVFSIKGQLYRPAQDCTLRYGHGVVLQRINYENGKWDFETINSLYPTTFRYNQGLHTFNHYKGIVVIDARGYRYPIIGRILTFLFKKIRKK